MSAVYVISGAKGGVGATTVAAVLALELSREDGPLVTAVDWTGTGDLAAVLGVVVPVGAELVQVRPGLVLGWPESPATLAGDVVIDAGTDPASVLQTVDPAPCVSVRVVRDDYLSLRHIAEDGPRCDRLVCMTRLGAALRPVDVEHVAGHRVDVVLPVDPIIARAVDAGLLSTRLPGVVMAAHVARGVIGETVTA